jgi:hypothetical protein
VHKEIKRESGEETGDECEVIVHSVSQPNQYNESNDKYKTVKRSNPDFRRVSVVIMMI